MLLQRCAAFRKSMVSGLRPTPAGRLSLKARAIPHCGICIPDCDLFCIKETSRVLSQEPAQDSQFI
jgi:hypothetical protein